MNYTLVLSVIAIYLAAIFLVSWISSRKADNDSFFTGNRKSPWYIVAFAMLAASMSGVTFVSVPGMVEASNFSYLQMTLGFVAGQVIIAFILVPLFYKMNVISIYEYLENRFGITSYKTGAWFFFLSKMLGASVRVFLVCVVFQLLVFDPLGFPFFLNVLCTVTLVWIYTFRGGVKTVIWVDFMKSICLLVSIIFTIYYMSQAIDFGNSSMISSIFNHEYSRIFFFDDINDKRFFFKQFFAGTFVMIAMAGLDQDIMQRNLSCKNKKESQMNMLTNIVLQSVVITLFLMLGVLIYMYAKKHGITVTNSDEMFPKVVTGGYLPQITGILFILGLMAAAYSAAGSALTSLTTSFTVDILGATRTKNEKQIHRTRFITHIGMTIAMAVVIYIIHALNKTSVIDAVYILASYTYGPILGMFAFGILCKRNIKDKWIPYIAVAAPVLSFFIDKYSAQWLNGYKFSYELLLINAGFVYLGMWLIRKPISN